MFKSTAWESARAYSGAVAGKEGKTKAVKTCKGKKPAGKMDCVEA